jgi:hypothetical protein
VFLSWQAHFLPSHRRLWIYLADRSLRAAAGLGELGAMHRISWLR